ncbi:hypothetical protein BD410DRAFT_893045 [Rickenella mellea]|uniref:DNA replication checkpoint mediator MRC1 domain-containing protein n=1 Tax=Rickenella mellea TaxID=50990 RepID=A0A4R5XGS0_9AGAM|nr:hypothetical protein BD410DRAFT_893045 [Rickenella mellea]
MDANHPPSSPPIAKVKRTYGRRKETTDVAAENEPFSEPPAKLNQSSAGATEMDNSDSEGSPGDSGYLFSWQKDLKELDAKFDQDMDADSSLQQHSGALSAPKVSNSHLERAQNLFAENDGDASVATSSSVVLNASNASGSSGIVDPNDSENDAAVPPGYSSPMSPQHLHPINTPKTRSSPTPPTSDAGSDAGTSRKASNHSRNASSVGTGLTESSGTGNRKKGKAKGKKKGLTKAEVKESKYAQARLLADQSVSIPHKYAPKPVTHFLGNIATSLAPRPVAAHSVAPRVTKVPASSDPIQEFTSPSPAAVASLVPKELDSDEEMPDATAILRADAERLKWEQLAAIKQRAVATLQASPGDEDEDDDLEIEPPAEAKPLSNKGKGRALSLIPSNATKSSKLLDDTESFKNLAKSTFGQTRPDRNKIMTPATLKSKMHGMVRKRAAALVKSKDEEWVRIGGKDRSRLARSNGGDTGTGGSSLEQILGTLADGAALKGKSADQGNADGEGGDDEQSDTEWLPADRGSASPSPENGRSTVDSGDEEDADADAEDGDADDRSEDDVSVLAHTVTDTDDDHQERRSRLRTHRQGRQIVDSDSENDEMETEGLLSSSRILVPNTSFTEASPATMAQILSHRGSLSSMEEPSLDEDDKENDTRRMFDQGEDKENMAVPRHVPVGRPAGVPFGTQQRSASFALSGIAQSALTSSPENMEPAEIGRRRKPLQVDGNVDREDFLLSSPAILSSARNIETLSDSDALARSPSPASVLFKSSLGESSGGFSQFFQDDDGFVVPSHQDNDGAGGKLILQPAFGAALPEPDFANKFRGAGDPQELSLTLDTRLQPALDVTTQLRRKADDIFEKDQLFILEEASKKREKSPELYITENGLLTQTRPEDSTPLIYRHPPTQNSVIRSPQSTQRALATQRQPLGTLSFSDSFTSELETPSDRRPLSRLVKGRQTDQTHMSEDEEQPQSPSPIKTNAFNLIMGGPRKEHKKAKKPLGESNAAEFIEGEAHESDDDEHFGFGKVKEKDEDENDGEDQDGILEELVDDAEMDDSTLAADKVMEKVHEEKVADDAKLTKYHQDAVDGKFRVKRRSGVDVDGDSDDSDDDDARDLRRKIHKKRKVDGDTLEDLAKSDATRPFYDGYQKDLQDDDEDLSQLLANDDMEIVADDASDEDDEERETISAAEVKARLQEAARSNQPRQQFDPSDTTWVEYQQSSDDDELGVKEVNLKLKKIIRPRPGATEQDTDAGFVGQKRNSGFENQSREQLESWAKEQPARNLATGRSAASVTGHAQTKATQANKPDTYAAAGSTDHPKLRKAESMLANVTDKHSRFAV